MHSQTLKRFLAFSLLVATLALPATSVKPQQRKAFPIEQLPVKSDCPRPIALTLTATNPTSFDPADPNPAQVAQAHMSGLGDPTMDKNFIYTFNWKSDARCCQITKAVLTVNMKSNSTGQSTTSSDAGNDGIALMYQGSVVAPFNEAVYSGINRPFPVGQPATKVWNLTGAALNNLNSSHQLTFVVQDDTSVVSATLQIVGCCLAGPQPRASEAALSPTLRTE